MSDEKGDDIRAKAAFAIAKRALDDALMSDEDRAKKDALAKRNRSKRIAQIVIGGLLVIGLIGLLLNYWYWALLLGLLGAAGWYVRRRWRARRESKQKKPEAAPAEPKAKAKAIAPARKVRVEETKPAPAEISDESIDDDLAELKARMKR